jgi:hypothetical protein
MTSAARTNGGADVKPLDIWAKMKGAETLPFIFAANIPAGGSDAANPRHVAGPGAQNSSFKNFAGPGAQA